MDQLRNSQKTTNTFELAIQLPTGGHSRTADNAVATAEGLADSNITPDVDFAASRRKSLV